MDPRFSLKQYPRVDTVYKSKSSLNFETIQANVYENRKKSPLEEGYRWICHLLIGFSVGVIAFYMTLMEEFLIKLKGKHIQFLLNHGVTV